MKKKYFTKTGLWWATLLFLFMIALLVVLAVSRLFVYFSNNGNIVSASGHHNLSFRVFYLENDLFAESTIPPHLYFLMSFTDFIEIDSRFSVSFSEEMQIYYTYRAEKRFVIRPMGGDRVVFEESFPMTEISGETFADRLYFNAEVGEPGGVYTIFPKDHIAPYFEFVADQARQMAEENVIAQGIRGFSAELLVEFTYTVRAPEFGLSETITQGYRIQLTAELYTLSMTGAPSFEWSGNIASVHDSEITLPTVIFFVALFSGSIFGLLYTIKLMTSDSNKYRREADSILKKYSHEIVVYDKPVDLTKYEPMAVSDFRELLKLAINLNKHIMCYKNRTRTDFVVIVDDYACLYVINYNEGGE